MTNPFPSLYAYAFVRNACVCIFTRVYASYFDCDSEIRETLTRHSGGGGGGGGVGGSGTLSSQPIYNKRVKRNK